jgi:alpha-D-ribose 1-methylphosphonate 5-triphosphate synthase subunit PhnH
MLTQLPGFQDPIHDTQQTFRALLEALALPGSRQATVPITPPVGLMPSCAAAALTLFDLETTIWLQPGWSDDVPGWLLFHTGCQLTNQPAAADFAVIWNPMTLPDLATFRWGTSEAPEASTSLLIQCSAWTGGPRVRLDGPGILGELAVEVPLSADFWSQWQTMTQHYPLGLDVWCCHDQHVMGLPRTAHPHWAA